MQESKKKILASAVISEIKSSDKHLTIRGKLCDTKTNLNGVRVTEAFINEIVANAEDYSGTPLCADVRGLLNNRKIGHMYNKVTHEFMSSIIGSMLSFERLDGDDGLVSLVFTARIMKRYTKVCNALEQLFNEGRLKFSFEVCCGSYTTEEDGTLVIDADPANYLEGAAVVTLPACEEAVALELVAECLGEGDENMARKKILTEQTEGQIQPAVTAEEDHIEDEAEVNAEADTEVNVENAEAGAEVNSESEDNVDNEEVKETETNAESENEDDQEEKKDEEDECGASNENAEVYVDMTHIETDHVSTFDTDTGISTNETVEHRVNVYGPQGSLTSTEPAENASAENTAASDEHEESTGAEDDNGCKNSVSADEHVQDDGNNLIAQILEKLEKLSSRIEKIEAVAESISQHEEVASNHSEDVNAEAEQETDSNNNNEEEQQSQHIDAEKKWTLVNPFMSDMSVPQKKYSLLEEQPGNRTRSYSLL